MADEARVEVRGYRELALGNHQLAERIEEGAPRAFLGVAEASASAVRAQVPRRSGALAGSVGAALNEDAASVEMGGPGVPYAGWVEFGGSRRGRGGGIAERPYLDSGRYLYPTALDAEPQLVAVGEKAAQLEIARFRWATPKT